MGIVMQSKAETVEQYLTSLPAERREAISAVRAVILKNLQPGFVECMSFGMIGYCVPLARFPNTYNGEPIGVAALASQKQYMAVYLMNIYGHKPTHDWFVAEYKKTGKKLDMGKCCVRFKTLDDLPIELIGKTVAKCTVEQLIAAHEAAHNPAAVKKRRETRRAAGLTKPRSKKKK